MSEKLIPYEGHPRVYICVDKPADKALILDLQGHGGYDQEDVVI